MKTIAECTSEEALNFIKLYFATVELLLDAMDKYQRLSVESTSSSSRSRFRALALEAERDLELLKNHRRAFIDAGMPIKPPSTQAVNKTKKLAADLAKIVAKDAQANAIIAIATKGLDAFNKVTAAA
jgi:hypothetical protein